MHDPSYKDQLTSELLCYFSINDKGNTSPFNLDKIPANLWKLRESIEYTQVTPLEGFPFITVLGTN